MKILISSHYFHPRVGGIETVGRLLAEEFVAAGHTVRVITSTVESDDRAFPFEILRGPTPARLLDAVRWCDIFLHNNVSLQTAWPLLLVRRPWLISHHVWIPQFGMGGRVALAGALKRFVIRHARSVAVSRAMGKHVGGSPVVIPNPYEDDIFKLLPGTKREGDLIFAGRLVSDKGADLLIRALAELRRRGLKPVLTVAGSGPEHTALVEMARSEGVEEQVNFVGVRTGGDLARLYNAHRIVAIPSRWAEPFGLVALEGVACGCVAVGSAQGGLPEAMGPCGLTFENGDANGLADQLGKC